MKETNELQKEFHELWIKEGQPHPNSNKYLALNRAFFFTKGYELGIKDHTENRW